jgi:hypothetical protein
MDSNQSNAKRVARPYILCEANGSFIIVPSQADVTTLVRSEVLNSCLGCEAM